MVVQSSLHDLKSSSDLQTEVKTVSSSSTIIPICNKCDLITHDTGEAISIKALENNNSFPQTTVGKSHVQQEKTSITLIHMPESAHKTDIKGKNCKKEIVSNKYDSSISLNSIENKSLIQDNEIVDKSMNGQSVSSINTGAVKYKCEEKKVTDQLKVNLVTSSLSNDTCTPEHNATETKEESILHIIEVQKRLQQNLLKRKMEENPSRVKRPKNLDSNGEPNNSLHLEHKIPNLSIIKNSGVIHLSEKKETESNKESSHPTKNINLESIHKSNFKYNSTVTLLKANPENSANQKCIPSSLSTSGAIENSVKNSVEKLKLQNLTLDPIDKSNKPNLSSTLQSFEECCFNKSNTTTLFNEPILDRSKPNPSQKSSDQNKFLNTSPQMNIYDEKSVDGLVSQIFEEAHTPSMQLSKQPNVQETIVKTSKNDSTESCTSVNEIRDVTKECRIRSNQPDVSSITPAHRETNTLSSLNHVDSIVNGPKSVDIVTGQPVNGEENITLKIISDKTRQNESKMPAVSDNTVSSSCAIEQRFSISPLSVNSRGQDILAVEPQPLGIISSPKPRRTQKLPRSKNAELNKLLQDVFHLYKEVFQKNRKNQRVIVPEQIKFAAIQFFQLMKRNIIVDDKDVPFILLRTYYDKFKETTEINITKLAEVLHLSIADSNRRDERLNSACKLTSSSLREEEKTRAQFEYQKSINSRSITFKNIFSLILQEFNEAVPILLMPLYFRITQALLRFDEDNAANVYLVRKQMVCLLTNDDRVLPMPNNVREEVLSFLTFPDEYFLLSFTFVKEVLVSFCLLACDRSEAKEVLAFAKFEPCSLQLQLLLSKQQQNVNWYQDMIKKKSNSTCILPQAFTSTLPFFSTNTQHQTQTSHSYQIPPSNSMQILAAKKQNIPVLVTHNQGSSGRVPKVGQQFKMHPHNVTYLQNQTPIQGVQQQMFQNAKQNEGQLVQRPFQTINQLKQISVLPSGYQQSSPLQIVQNSTYTSIVHEPNQQSMYNNYLPANIAEQTFMKKHTELQRRLQSSNSASGIEQNIQIPRTKQSLSNKDPMFQQRPFDKETVQGQYLTDRGQRPAQPFDVVGPEQLLVPLTKSTTNLSVESSIQRVANTEVTPYTSDPSAVSIFITTLITLLNNHKKTI